MDFSFSGESKMMVKAARTFNKQVIEPVVALMEEENALPDSLLQAFAKARMLGLMVPREYGGADSSALNLILISEELAKSGSAASWVMALNNSVAETIYHWGTEDVRKKFIPPLCHAGRRSLRTEWEQAIHYQRA